MFPLCCVLVYLTPLVLTRAILGLRNVCEGNVANQAVIGQLEKLGVVQDPDLGMELQVDDTTGKLRLRPNRPTS